MTNHADLSVRGGLEVSHLTAITHAVDDQKNRRQQQGRKRRKAPPEAEPDTVDQEGGDEPDDETPTVDYLV